MSLTGSQGKPAEKVLATGGSATLAKFDKVSMRTVPCSDGGSTLVGDGDGKPTHNKTQFLSINLKEQRLDTESGYYTDFASALTQKRRSQIAALSVELNGETFDLMGANPGKLQFVFAKTFATLPVQALLSVQYTSVLGGTWYVDKQPVELDFGEPKAGCCVLM